jgi:protease-4
MGSQLRGAIAAERVVQVIRQVRDDERVGALVMRLNTPGGSAFASELIRQELELTQLAGKPVVVSMGPLAASGGYWIAATADAIVAEPTTLTGSIGVFGIVPTFEDSLASVGVTSDGVRTSPLTAVNPLAGISDATASVLQTGTEHAYRRFLTLVARGRDLTLEQVEEVAQGRVWLGSQALDLGLVDALGDQETAIARAAELAGLTDYGVRRIEPPLSTQERLLRQFLSSRFSPDIAEGWFGGGAALPPLVRQASEAWRMVQSLNDPRHSYALCLACNVAGP